MRRACGTALLAVVAAGALAGCGSAQDAAVRSVASAFVNELENGDGAGACHLLAPVTRAELEKSTGMPCSAAILEEDLPTAGAFERTAAYGTMAQVRFAADTVFLTEFRNGWRVLAAGCSPVPGSPYDCQVQGG
jgi:hypothetical protein